MILALLVALTALVVACGQANEAEEPTGGGIQVHGHWTVTVTDPDGTVAHVHEFDNALEGSGRAMLAALLAGEARIQTHFIHIWRPFTPATGGWNCAEAVLNNGLYSRVPAVMTKDSEEKKVNSVMLSGVCTVLYSSLAAPTEAQITSVATAFASDSAYEICGGSMCYDLSAGAPAEFTSHEEIIPVANGQIVAFNIAFSFE